MHSIGPALAVFFVFVMIIVAIGAWFLQFSMDRERIKAYLEQRQGRVISINWAPFGKGWFGEKNDRIYEVVYYDKTGNQHFATCKTSLWSGVYWTDDRITHRKSGWYDTVSPSNEPGKPLIGQIVHEEEEIDPDELTRLRQENARLREKLADRGSSIPSLSTLKCPACGTAISPQANRCPDCGIALG